MEMEFQSLHELKEYMALHSSADQDYVIKLSVFVYLEKGAFGKFKNAYNKSAAFSQKRMADEEQRCLEFFRKHGIAYEMHEETTLTEPVKISGKPIYRHQNIVHKLRFSVSTETAKKIIHDDKAAESQALVDQLKWHSGEWYEKLCGSEATKETCDRITEYVLQVLEEAKKEDLSQFSISIQVNTYGCKVRRSGWPNWNDIPFWSMGYESLQNDKKACAVAAAVTIEVEKKLRAYPSVCEVFIKSTTLGNMDFTVEFSGKEPAQPEQNLRSW